MVDAKIIFRWDGELNSAQVKVIKDMVSALGLVINNDDPEKANPNGFIHIQKVISRYETEELNP